MSLRVPKTFYGAGYAVCAVIFFVSFMSSVEEKFRVLGIALGCIFFAVVTAIYAWEKGEYYRNLQWQVQTI